jgi:hypothetical protein
MLDQRDYQPSTALLNLTRYSELTPFRYPSYGGIDEYAYIIYLKSAEKPKEKILVILHFEGFSNTQYSREDLGIQH